MKVLCIVLFLVALVTAQVRTPDRFVNAGVTFALNQEMLDSMKTVNFEICKELNQTMTNLHINRFLSLDVESPFDKTEKTEILTWSISGLNITNVTFDQTASHFMLIEPT